MFMIKFLSELDNIKTIKRLTVFWKEYIMDNNVRKICCKR